jgi:hypothetical protein
MKKNINTSFVALAKDSSREQSLPTWYFTTGPVETTQLSQTMIVKWFNPVNTKITPTALCIEHFSSRPLLIFNFVFL